MNRQTRTSRPINLHHLAAVSWAVLMAAPAVAMTTSPVVSGTTVTAASCNYDAVNAAVGVAASMNAAGWTVAIPAGTCAWGANQLVVPGRIALKGAGRDLTIIKRTAAVSDQVYLVRFECYMYKNANFSNMTLAGANPYLSQDRGLGLIGTCVDFKVSNSKFTHFASAGIELRGGPTQSGVIYSNQFINNYVKDKSYGYGIAVYGDGTWPDLKLGIEKDPLLKYPSAVYVENNYMSGNRHHIASNNGARYVFRYNTAIATDLTKDFPQVDAHGKHSWPRGTRSWEVYNNNFSASLTTGGSIAIGMRGGDGVIFNNTYGNKITRPIQLSMEEQKVDYTNSANNCLNYPAGTIDNITSAYIVEESRQNLITNLCPARLREGVEYHLKARPSYTPFVHPHPLRAN